MTSYRYSQWHNPQGIPNDPEGLKEHFKSFLRQEGIYDSFCGRVRAKSNRTLNGYLSSRMRRLYWNVEYWILEASSNFDPEGYNFWSDKSIKWREYVSVNIKKVAPSKMTIYLSEYEQPE